MKMLRMYSPKGNDILAPETDVEYLLSKGWTQDKPKQQSKKKAVVETEDQASQETE